MEKRVALLLMLLMTNLFCFSALISPSTSPKIMRFPELPNKNQELCAFIEQYGCGPGLQIPGAPYLSEITREYVHKIKAHLLARVGICVQEVQLNVLDEIIQTSEADQRSDVIKVIIEYLYSAEHAPVLCLLAGEGYVSSCDILLRHGDSVNRRNILGKTALMRSAQNGHYNMTHFLLSKKPDIGALNLNGQSAFDLAFENHHPEIGLLITQAITKQLDSLNKIS